MITATRQDLLELARKVGPALKANAERADREGRLPAESMEILREAGFLRMYVPRSLGGLEVDPVTHARVQEEVSRYDSAAGWTLQVSASSAWWCSRLPDDTVEEIYAGGPDTLIAVSFGVPVEAEQADGGFVLTGQRQMASNVSDADWLWLTTLTIDGGQPMTVDGAPLMRAAFFPATDAKIVNTWDTLGMRGTDSNDVAVTELFVPERRTFRIGIDHSPGRHYEGPLYRAAVMVIVASYGPAVSLGIAQAAVDELVSVAQSKTPFSSATTLRERPVIQSKLGRALGGIEAARSFLYEQIAAGWDRALQGGELSLEEKTRILLACVQMTASSVRAVDLMYSAGGTTGIYKSSPLERHFRDAQVLRQHGFISESRYETVGQVALGLPPELGFVAL